MCEAGTGQQGASTPWCYIRMKSRVMFHRYVPLFILVEREPSRSCSETLCQRNRQVSLKTDRLQNRPTLCRRL
jgi:hypothetical protein